MHKSHLQEPKKPPKTIFSVFRTILDENLILKKKVQKFTRKCPKSRIFEISKFDLWPEMAENWPISTTKVPACPKFLPEFFISPNSKNSWKNLKNPTPEKSTFHFAISFLRQNNHSQNKGKLEKN